MGRLGRLLSPRSLAVVGGRPAELALEQCRRLGFDGDLWILEEELSSELTNKLRLSDINESGNTNIILYETNNVMIETISDESSLMILTDIYYPGWKALIDGVETKIYRADGLVRAVFVPEGNHTVEFVYLPESYSTGIIISVI